MHLVDLLARGWTNGVVADELNLGTKTVERALTNVCRKLDPRSRTELAVKVAGLRPGAKTGDFPGRRARS